MRIRFFMFIGTICLVGGLAQWLMYRHAFGPLRSKWTLLVCVLLPVCFILPHLDWDWLPVGVARVLAHLGGYWLVFFYYSLFLLIIYGILHLGFWLCGQKDLWATVSHWLAAGGMLMVLALVVVGGWRARHPVYRQVDVPTTKNLTRDVKIALVTDIHLGTILGQSYCENLVQMLNQAQPDVIIFGGDLVDDSLSFVQREGSYQSLKELKAPLGVYAVFGNHDYIAGNTAGEKQLFEAEGLQFLRNESKLLPVGIELTGVDDYSRDSGNHGFKEATAQNQGLLRIVVDHQPRRMDTAAATGYDLYLAGHTHAGQFYPNRLVTQKLYQLDYGAAYFGKLLAVVSDGYGFWGAPVRIGPSPEVVILKVHKQ